MRIWATLTAMVLLAACAPTVPDSGAGVGFQDYNNFEQERAARDAALQSGRSMVPDPRDAPLTAVAGSTTTVRQMQPVGTSDAEAVAADTRSLLQRPQGISDEQDFAAVSERQSIESDRQRIQAQREQYQVITPTAVPTRPSALGENVAAFAVSTSHPVGTRVYDRGRPPSASTVARNCQRYSSPNEAQQAFLAAGGPERDRNDLDPDGDGYACGWDPAPFRTAVRN